MNAYVWIVLGSVVAGILLAALYRLLAAEPLANSQAPDSRWSQGIALGIVVAIVLGIVLSGGRWVYVWWNTPTTPAAAPQTVMVLVPADTPTPIVIVVTATAERPTATPIVVLATATAPAAPPAANPPANPPNPVPAASAPAASLKYDETGGVTLTTGQTRLVADYLREAMAASGTQAAMEKAIASIQIEAANAKATTAQGKTLKLDQRVAWLVWCSDSTNADFPTDTSDVFDKIRQGPGKVWIQVPFATGVPLRSKDTFSGCNAPSGFWAVRVH
jgi:hypothetical protein